MNVGTTSLPLDLLRYSLIERERVTSNPIG